MKLSESKKRYMDRLSNEKGIISALAFDQRGALRKLIAQNQTEAPTAAQMERLKELVAEELTPYASSMLLDPEFGLPAIKKMADGAGLLLAYEKTGYDTNSSERLPDCLEIWSAKRLKEKGADAVKFLLYYDPDGNRETNEKKQAYIERVGSECKGEDIPFFLEILSYDENDANVTGREYAAKKPHKVIESMRVFSDPRFGIDVLKVEVPVNMNYVEGFSSEEPVYTRQQALDWFRAQDEVSNVPYIYLSAGVSADLFRRTLLFAKEAGSHFSGVLCGRATWVGCVAEYVKNGEEAARTWLRTEGRKNIEELNEVLKETAVSWNKEQ